MAQVQFSISRKDLASGSTAHFFFFRTDWMEAQDADLITETLLSKFPSPEFKITRNERSATITYQDLN